MTKFLKQKYERLTLDIKILKRPRKSSFLGACSYRARFFHRCVKCFTILLTCFSVLKHFLGLWGGLGVKTSDLDVSDRGSTFLLDMLRPCARRERNKLPYPTKCPHRVHKSFEDFSGSHITHTHFFIINIVLRGILEVGTERFFEKNT